MVLHVHLGMASSHCRIAKSETFANLLKFLPKPFLCRFVSVFNLPSHLEFQEAYASLLNNSESRMLQDDGSQALLLNPDCLL